MRIEETLQKLIFEKADLLDYKSLISDIFRFYESYNSKNVICFCSYIPVELLAAAGLQPIRIIGLNTPVSLSDFHIQAYGCHVVRSILDMILNRNLPKAMALLFSHTCDSMQCLPEIAKLHTENIELEYIMTPTRLNSQHSENYYIRELHRLRDFAQKLSGSTVTEDNLRHEIERYNRLRKKMQELTNVMAAGFIPGLAGRIHLLQIAANMLNPDLVLPFIEELYTRVKESESANADRKRIFLSGNILYHDSIFGIIEDLGGWIVGEDFCTGSRVFEYLQIEEDDPYHSLAVYYLNRYHCPAKHSLPDRIGRVAGRAEDLQADGVVFFPLKFCDPLAFELPDTQKFLSERQLPSTVIEIDSQSFSLDAIRTRIQAFMESLDESVLK